MEIVNKKYLKVSVRRGLYVRVFDLLTLEVGWFDQELEALGIELFKFMDDGGFVNTFFFTIIRIQVLKLSASVHVSGGVYNS